MGLPRLQSRALLVVVLLWGGSATCSAGRRLHDDFSGTEMPTGRDSDGYPSVSPKGCPRADRWPVPSPVNNLRWSPEAEQSLYAELQRLQFPSTPCNEARILIARAPMAADVDDALLFRLPQEWAPTCMCSYGSSCCPSSWTEPWSCAKSLTRYRDGRCSPELHNLLLYLEDVSACKVDWEAKKVFDARGRGEPLDLPEDMHEASGVGQVMEDLFAVRMMVAAESQASPYSPETLKSCLMLATLVIFHLSPHQQVVHVPTEFNIRASKAMGHDVYTFDQDLRKQQEGFGIKSRGVLNRWWSRAVRERTVWIEGKEDASEATWRQVDYMIHSLLMKWIFVPKPPLVAKAQHLVPPTIKHPMAVIHIRQTDKREEDKYWIQHHELRPLEHYYERLGAYEKAHDFKWGTIFVLSDSHHVVKISAKEIAEQFPHADVLTDTPITALEQKHIDAKRRKGRYHLGHTALGGEEKKQHYEDFISVLFAVSSQADYLVGSFSSNVARVIAEMLSANGCISQSNNSMIGVRASYCMRESQAHSC
eukprot:scaffold1439_cov404-Prasinococcus_capsulatus_cf.AAC.52